MKLIIFILTSSFLLIFQSCQRLKPLQNQVNIPPKPIGFDEDELSKMRAKYVALIHTAPPGVNWKQIEAANVENNIQLKLSRQRLRPQGLLTIQESFANGKLKGTWSERGSHNQAGSIIAADYDSIGNNLYVISAGGSIWKNSGLTVNDWTLINDNYIFENNLIKVISTAEGGTRIFTIVNNRLSYSDNGGSTFSPSNIPFPINWEGNTVRQMKVLKSGNNHIYLIAYIWDNTISAARMALYQSTNEGSSFTRIYTFNHSEAPFISLIQPYNTNDIYVADCKGSAGNIQLWKVTGSTVTLANIAPQPETLVGSPQFAATYINNTLSMYLMNNNTRIYYSGNTGISWAFKGTLPQNSWDRLDVSNTDMQKLYTGGVEAMRSYNGGTNWTIVNSWNQYYNNVAGKLHADIMSINQWKKSDGTPFTIINNHGGVAISYDDLATTNNLSINGLHSAQYYDILTALDNPNIIYGGTQDQGMHKNTSALTPGLLSFDQFISGDYGYLTLADIYKTLYCQYPGGSLYIYNHPNGNYIRNWTMPGTQKPNYGWMMPIKNTANVIGDTILMAGGNINGGGGSYLCRIAMQSVAPNNINATQYPFDFRANSNNGNAGITAIEVNGNQPEKIYTATEDGTFFYSNNSGASWSKSGTFSVGGGWYLYGSTICASRLTNNLVWYGGSGYAGSAVFKSTNGGQTFSAMSNGLPQTLVHEIVANLNESMLFAATDAGPYVYVVEDNTWYPMIGSDNPIQAYTAVEFITASNTVRFATHGRGIFDFAVTEPVVYYFFGDGNWNNPANWVNQLMPPAVLSGNHEVLINPYGQCTLNINQTINNGAKLTIAKDKKFTITGNLRQQ